MSRESFLDGKIDLYCGDMLAVLPTLAENSIDSVVCDPPYHLTSIVKRFGSENAAPAKVGKTGAYARASSGFMGKQWDGGDIAFRVETWREVFRVMKPGAHLVAFSGTRTYHLMVSAIDQAGFEIRDQIGFAFGSGFPKSHDVSKGIDREAGAVRQKIGQDHNFGKSRLEDGKNTFGDYAGSWDITTPTTHAAREWDGWGTALKPAWEPIVVARKPLSESTIAANVLKWGTGAINIDGCRIEGQSMSRNALKKIIRSGNFHAAADTEKEMSHYAPHDQGRWPANLIHDGSEEVVAAFPETKSGALTRSETATAATGKHGIYGVFNGAPDGKSFPASEGNAARFFYTAKADSDDRLGSKHPTVKPLDLMQYLVRLVTPKGGICLDPFAGTGTTGEAAFREGMRAVLIEREAEYQDDIRRRMKLVLGGPDERARESIKAKMKDRPQDHGPLFGGEAKDTRGGAGRFTESSRTNNRPDRIEVVTE